jgi:hypothetical protein
VESASRSLSPPACSLQPQPASSSLQPQPPATACSHSLLPPACSPRSGAERLVSEVRCECGCVGMGGCLGRGVAVWVLAVGEQRPLSAYSVDRVCVSVRGPAPNAPWTVNPEPSAVDLRPWPKPAERCVLVPPRHRVDAPPDRLTGVPTDRGSEVSADRRVHGPVADGPMGRETYEMYASPRPARDGGHLASVIGRFNSAMTSARCLRVRPRLRPPPAMEFGGEGGVGVSRCQTASEAVSRCETASKGARGCARGCGRRTGQGKGGQ